MRYIVLLLMLMASQANAAWYEFNGFSIGSSYRPVTGTTVAVTSATTVSSTALATSDTSIMRVVCDQYASYGHGPLLSTISLVTPSTVKLVPDMPEYFTLPANNAPAFRAYGTSASCNAVRMGK